MELDILCKIMFMDTILEQNFISLKFQPVHQPVQLVV